MRVEAHLHIARARAGNDTCISVRDLPDGKVRYVNWLTLSDVTFAVQKAGLARFRTTGHKNVHAFVRGTKEYEDCWATTENAHGYLDAGWRMVYYNPATCDYFMDLATGQRLTTAKQAVLVGSKVYYK